MESNNWIVGNLQYFSNPQLSYITNVDVGHVLLKLSDSLVPFSNQFPRNTQLYWLMTTNPGEILKI